MKTLQEYIKEGDSKEKSIRNYWTDIAKKHLVGKKIVAVRYLSNDDLEFFMWHSAPLEIQLEDGHWLTPSMDDEGNDGGAVFTTYEKLPCIPTI